MTPDYVYILSANILSVIAILGFFLNFAVLYVVIKDRKNLWKPINLIIVNLSVKFFSLLKIINTYI